MRLERRLKMGRTKFTNEQREEIKRLYATGQHGPSELAKMFDCSRYYIYLILDDKKYEEHKNRVNQYAKKAHDKLYTTCPNCGRNHSIYDKFCACCGMKFDNE